jgi:chromosome partitioning protein
MDTPRPVRTVALINQKGGVGKTTTAVNLAAGVALLGRPTLLVDLDPQAHATLHLGVNLPSTAGTVYDALLDPDGDPSRYLIEARPNLALLPSQTDLAAAELEIASESDRNQRLAKSLSRLGDRYEFIFIDCPPSLGLLTLNALCAAREVFVPMQAHFLSLQGVSKLLDTIRRVTASLNPRLRVTGVVMCMFDAQATHTQEVLADLEQFFENARGQDVPWRVARVYRPFIRRNIKLAECPSFGQSVFDYNAQAPGAADYRRLAETFVSEWDLMLQRRAGAESLPARPEITVVGAEPAAAAGGAA